MGAVLFDLDGTLIASEGMVGQALARSSAEHGLPWNEDLARWAVGRTWESVFTELEKPLDPADRSAFRRRTLALFEAHELAIIPGAPELLQALAGRVPLGIVTGSTRPQLERAIDDLGIRGQLDVTISEDDVTRSKPDPEPYLLAMQALRVERALVFEDSVAGIAAGRAAGCHVVAVEHANTVDQDQTAAHEHVHDLTGIDLAWCRARL